MKTYPGSGPWVLDLLRFRITSLGDGKIWLTQGHTCHRYATWTYTSLGLFVLFLVQIPAGEECTLRARGSIKGSTSVDSAWGQLASEGQA